MAQTDLITRSGRFAMCGKKVGNALIRIQHHRGWFVLMLICLAALVSFALAKPQVDWDVLGYTGAALQWFDEPDIHGQAYEIVAKAVPEQFESLITDSTFRSSNYRSTMYANPDAFEQQLPYYAIRPAYTALLALGHRFGVSIVDMMVYLSMMSCSIIGLLMYWRLSRDLSPLASLLICVPLLLVFRLPAFAGFTTVDPMITAGVMSMILAFERGLSFKLFLPLLLMLICIRSNAVVFTFPFIVAGMIAYQAKLPCCQFSPLQGVIALIGSLLLMKLIEVFVGNYGWWTVFYFTFVESMNFPAEFNQGFDFSQYITAVLNGGRWILSDRYATVFMLGLCIFIVHAMRQPWRKETSVLALIFFSMIVIFIGHFLLFPAVFLRFFCGLYLLAMMYSLLAVITQSKDAVPSTELKTS